MEAKPFILIVEDETELASTIAYSLEREGFFTRHVTTGRGAIEAVTRGGTPDVVLLDLMLPDLAGTEVCRELRRSEGTRSTPIVFLTAKDSEIDRVVAFELGADDYVCKPFSIRELVLRIRALLRRTKSQRHALRAHTLGFVFQFHHLLPMFTALESVMLPAWGDEGFPSESIKERAAELLQAVGLADRMHFKATQLSGDQQQRVAIARALSRHPPLVLADEPTGNLDTKSSAEVFALMRRFNRELGTTFLIVTHDPRIAKQCDRVIEMVDGRIVSGET